MEWDWWSRMHGPSSASKRPGRGKWWSNLGSPKWSVPRWGGQWSRFGTLPAVDLDLIHVKTLEEIRREKELKKKREQHCGILQTSNQVKWMRLSQIDSRKEKKHRDEDVEEGDVRKNAEEEITGSKGENVEMSSSIPSSQEQEVISQAEPIPQQVKDSSDMKENKVEHGPQDQAEASEVVPQDVGDELQVDIAEDESYHDEADDEMEFHCLVDSRGEEYIGEAISDYERDGRKTNGLDVQTRRNACSEDGTCEVLSPEDCPQEVETRSSDKETISRIIIPEPTAIARACFVAIDKNEDNPSPLGHEDKTNIPAASARVLTATVETSVATLVHDKQQTDDQEPGELEVGNTSSKVMHVTSQDSTGTIKTQKNQVRKRKAKKHFWLPAKKKKTQQVRDVSGSRTCDKIKNTRKHVLHRTRIRKQAAEEGQGRDQPAKETKDSFPGSSKTAETKSSTGLSRNSVVEDDFTRLDQSLDNSTSREDGLPEGSEKVNVVQTGKKSSRLSLPKKEEQASTKSKGRLYCKGSKAKTRNFKACHEMSSKSREGVSRQEQEKQEQVLSTGSSPRSIVTQGDGDGESLQGNRFSSEGIDNTRPARKTTRNANQVTNNTSGQDTNRADEDLQKSCKLPDKGAHQIEEGSTRKKKIRKSKRVQVQKVGSESDDVEDKSQEDRGRKKTVRKSEKLHVQESYEDASNIAESSARVLTATVETSVATLVHDKHLTDDREPGELEVGNTSSKVMNVTPHDSTNTIKAPNKVRKRKAKKHFWLHTKKKKTQKVRDVSGGQTSNKIKNTLKHVLHRTHIKQQAAEEGQERDQPAKKTKDSSPGSSKTAETKESFKRLSRNSVAEDDSTRLNQSSDTSTSCEDGLPKGSEKVDVVQTGKRSSLLSLPKKEQQMSSKSKGRLHQKGSKAKTPNYKACHKRNSRSREGVSRQEQEKREQVLSTGSSPQSIVTQGDGDGKSLQGNRFSSEGTENIGPSRKTMSNANQVANSTPGQDTNRADEDLQRSCNLPDKGEHQIKEGSTRKKKRSKSQRVQVQKVGSESDDVEDETLEDRGRKKTVKKSEKLHIPESSESGNVEDQRKEGRVTKKKLRKPKMLQVQKDGSESVEDKMKKRESPKKAHLQEDKDTEGHTCQMALRKRCEVLSPEDCPQEVETRSCDKETSSCIIINEPTAIARACFVTLDKNEDNPSPLGHEDKTNIPASSARVLTATVETSVATLVRDKQQTDNQEPGELEVSNTSSKVMHVTPQDSTNTIKAPNKVRKRKAKKHFWLHAKKKKTQKVRDVSGGQTCNKIKNTRKHVLHRTHIRKQAAEEGHVRDQPAKETKDSSPGSNKNEETEEGSTGLTQNSVVEDDSTRLNQDADTSTSLENGLPELSEKVNVVQTEKRSSRLSLPKKEQQTFSKSKGRLHCKGSKAKTRNYKACHERSSISREGVSRQEQEKQEQVLSPGSSLPSIVTQDDRNGESFLGNSFSSEGTENIRPSRQTTSNANQVINSTSGQDTNRADEDLQRSCKSPDKGEHQTKEGSTRKKKLRKSQSIQVQSSESGNVENQKEGRVTKKKLRKPHMLQVQKNSSESVEDKMKKGKSPKKAHLQEDKDTESHTCQMALRKRKSVFSVCNQAMKRRRKLNLDETGTSPSKVDSISSCIKKHKKVKEEIKTQKCKNSSSSVGDSFPSPVEVISKSSGDGQDHGIMEVGQATDSSQPPQTVSSTQDDAFAEILANQPQVVLSKLEFEGFIPQSLITSKQRRQAMPKRRDVKGQMLKKRKTHKFTETLNETEQTCSKLGFTRPSKLAHRDGKDHQARPISFALPLEEAHTQPTPFQILDGDQQDKTVFITREDNAKHLKCSGEIVEAPEVAHTVEVTSSDGFSSPTSSISSPTTCSQVQAAVMSILPQAEQLPPSNSQIERTMNSQLVSSRLTLSEGKMIEYELNNQVQILSNEYNLMGAVNALETLPSTSSSAKVVVSPVVASDCSDVLLASLSSQSPVESCCSTPSTNNLVVPTQMFLSEMTKADDECPDIALMPLSDQLDLVLSSPELFTALNAAAEEASHQECGENMEHNGGAFSNGTKPGSRSGAEQGNSQQQNIFTEQSSPQDISSPLHALSEVTGLQDAHNKAFGDFSFKEMDSEKAGVEVESAPEDALSLIPPVSHIAVSSSPVHTAVVTSLASPSQETQSQQLDQPSSTETVSRNVVHSSSTDDNGEKAAVVEQPNDGSKTTPANDSVDASGDFSNLSLSALEEDFSFPEEDCISLMCDSENFLSDLADELTEIDKEIRESQKGTKSKSPPKQPDRNPCTNEANNATQTRKCASLSTVDWSEVAQYQPINSSLGAGDCSTEDSQRFIRNDPGNPHIASQPSMSLRCQVNENQASWNEEQTVDLPNEDEGPQPTTQDSDCDKSPASLFEATISIQRCTFWKETSRALIQLCQERPDVARSKPVIQELLNKLHKPPEMVGDKFRNFAAVFKRQLESDNPCTANLKRVLSRLGINCTILSCSYRHWQQAHCILACLHRGRFPYLQELNGDVVIPHPQLESQGIKHVAEVWVPLAIHVCAEVGELDIAAELLENTTLPKPVVSSTPHFGVFPVAQYHYKNLVHLTKLSADRLAFPQCLVFLKDLHQHIHLTQFRDVCDYALDKALTNQNEAYFTIYQEMEKDPTVLLGSGNYRRLVGALWDSSLEYKQHCARRLHLAGLNHAIYPSFQLSRLTHEATMLLDFHLAEVILTIDLLLTDTHTRNILASRGQSWTVPTVRISFSRPQNELSSLRDTRNNLQSVTRLVNRYLEGLTPPIKWIKSTSYLPTRANILPTTYSLDLNCIACWLRHHDAQV